MTTAAIITLIIAGALRTRLGKLSLAGLLLKVSNILGDAGSRILENVKREVGQ